MESKLSVVFSERSQCNFYKPRVTLAEPLLPLMRPIWFIVKCSVLTFHRNIRKCGLSQPNVLQTSTEASNHAVKEEYSK